MSSTTRRGSRRTGSIKPHLLLISAVLVGCQQPDTRIPLSQLREMERLRALRETPVPVNAQQLALPEVQPYRIQIGDELAIQMTGLGADRYAQTALQVRVHADGTIMLPALGALPVEGLTLGELEQTIAREHAEKEIVRDLAVYVQLQGPEQTTVLVVGAAAAPGLVQLRADERGLLHALGQAGGFNRQTSGRILLKPIDPARDTEEFDLTDVNDVRRMLQAPPLQSGDIVLVEAAKMPVVYLVGLVNSAGPVPIPEGTSISMMRAIAAAGGLVDFIDPQDATLWRQVDNGQQVRVKIDLAAVTDGQAEDLLLTSGDILEIPHTARTRVRQWFAQNIRLGPFGVTAVYDPVADYRARILRDDDNGDNVFQRTLLQSVGTGIADIVIPPPAPQ